MGQDFPDWGGQYNGLQFYPLFDMAELAARLGSLATYDRRGSILWQYGFDYGVGDVEPTVSGAGSAVGLATAYWETPPASCILQAGTTDGAYASIVRRLPIPQANKVGVQASVRASTSVSEIYVNLRHFIGGQLYFTWLLVDLDNLLLKVRTQEAGILTLRDPMEDLAIGYYFAHLKIVADLSNHRLMRALIDDEEFDLSAYTMPSIADNSSPHIYAEVRNVGHNLVYSYAYVDNVIVTASEPDNV